jgi:hypothetical protein
MDLQGRGRGLLEALYWSSVGGGGAKNTEIRIYDLPNIGLQLYR